MKGKEEEKREWEGRRDGVKIAMPKLGLSPPVCLPVHSKDSIPRAPYSLSLICHRRGDISKARQGARRE